MNKISNIQWRKSRVSNSIIETVCMKAGGERKFNPLVPISSEKYGNFVRMNHWTVSWQPFKVAERSGKISVLTFTAPTSTEAVCN